MIKIDLKKLEQVILNEMADCQLNNFDGEALISNVDGVQVSIRVVTDEDEFFGSDCTDDNLCVTDIIT